MKRPICVKCQTGFRNIKSGIKVIDIFSCPPKPYKIWLADLFECPICKTQIVSGFGQNPISQHYETDFDYWLHEDRSQIYNYEYPEDTLNPIQRLIEAIGRHEPMANDPAVIDAINAIEDVLIQPMEETWE